MDGVRPVGELLAAGPSAWPRVAELVSQAQVPVRVLPTARSSGESTLFRLQVTPASTLGAIAVNSGGILVDHGWLRMLAAGTDELPGIASANQLTEPSLQAPPPWLVVAYDVLGGRFAINGGRGPTGAPGEVAYWAPDTLEWEPTGLGHSRFVQWAMTSAIRDFYADCRWSGWEGEVADLALSRGISIYPPLFTAQGRDVASASRKAIPMTELHAMQEDLALQVRELPDGSSLKLRIDPDRIV